MTQRRKRYDRQFKVSAAKVVLSGEMTVKGLSEELGIKDSTLRRWACEYEEMGDDAFPVHSVKQESTFGDADENPIQTKAVWRPACTQGKIS